jgi:hypothetical protein
MAGSDFDFRRLTPLLLLYGELNRAVLHLKLINALGADQPFALQSTGINGFGVRIETLSDPTADSQHFL